MKEPSRIIGEYGTGAQGDLLFVTAGIHGNEPSGVIALQNVFRTLATDNPTVHGKVVGISGNLAALEKDVRYIEEDLNRVWTNEKIAQNIPQTHEQKEMRQIISTLENYPAQHFGKRYFLDCHTTSSKSLPYISVQEVNDNDSWAHKFPTYIVRGFSDLIQGDIDHYLSRTGLTGFVFEGGQHTSRSAIENHEGMIWLALKEALHLDLEALSCYPQCVEHFSTHNAPGQKTFEIVYRHGLDQGDVFEMVPGFQNFDPVHKGQLLAHQNGRPIYSEHQGHIFLPLYQAKGNDGFFIIKEV